MRRCYWCLSPAPLEYPCCVPAWFFQIHVHETTRRILSQPDIDLVRFKLDPPKFSSPDNPEE